VRKLRAILRYLGTCDGNMEEGSMRADVNVSLRRPGAALGTRAEIKNVNSIRFIQAAIEYETTRQMDILEEGGEIVQETRLFDPDSGTTRSMRTKEEAHDYRYFPDPDLPPLLVDPAWIDRIRAEIPELPGARQARYMEQHGLSEQDARFITLEPKLDAYFAATVEAGAKPKRAANWVMSELLSRVDPRDVTSAPPPERLAGLLALWDQGRINGALAKQIWPMMWDSGESAKTIAERENLFQHTDEAALDAEIQRVIAANPKQVEQFRGGKEKVLGFFVGQIMRATRGKANPQTVNQLLRKRLTGE
jgi:aspartyl-tRNA(Asn)/glutamyl-tRNA(Gln) amidotransferase subunit B